MLRIFIACFLAAATLGQAQPKGAQKQPATATPPSSPAPGAPSLKRPDEMLNVVAPTQPVLTVRGLCPADTNAATTAAVPATHDCVVQVTKEQFDKLLNAFNSANQPVTPAMRRQFAQAYVEIMTVAEAAKQAGVENSPAFQEVMRVIRMKTLADFYRSQLAQQFHNPPPEEIEAYYKENAAKYDSAKLTRIYVPKIDPDAQATAEQKDAYQKKAPQVADDLQARAAKGEPMDKLQKEGYTALGISAAPPTTDLSQARHGVFPPRLDQEIFSHKAGETFRSDDGNGYMIYRVESRQALPLESVKEEIVREVSRRKMEEKMKELTSGVQSDFNESYFGPPAPATPVSRPVPNPAR
jgi:parvulin-like peptidyl-prolyl cis-trans isomerase-like protein